ncbi:hypothetical protein PsYK624_113100 [Phanerochaete sordida]|uniref:Uncharacterized protein n=1 Tax=Phanerochaete sordida TaxID=48140 RepID=A0A9P3GJ02_9APHY|nr:hypothetical protein PsYK624_113100 [Phanerochaete sordida]
MVNTCYQLDTSAISPDTLQSSCCSSVAAKTVAWERPFNFAYSQGSRRYHGSVLRGRSQTRRGRRRTSIAFLTACPHRDAFVAPRRANGGRTRA